MERLLTPRGAGAGEGRGSLPHERALCQGVMETDMLDAQWIFRPWTLT